MKYGALYSALALLALTDVVHAQATSAPPPAPRPRIGYAGTPTPPPAQQPAPQPVFLYSPGGYVYYGAPYEVLSDGSVLVNFGYGYERVLRQCAGGARGASEVNQNGRDALGRILDPPGIAALKAGTRGQATGPQPPRDAAACYRADQQGRVEMLTETMRSVRY